MKYAVKHLNEVFSPEFAEYVITTLNGEPATSEMLIHIMREVQHYEVKRMVEFVSFFGNDMIIFKAKS